MWFSLYREPAREFKGEVNLAKLFSLLFVVRLPSIKVRLVAGIPLSECWEDVKGRGLLIAVRESGVE